MAGRRGHKGGKKKVTSLLHTRSLAQWLSGPAGWVQSHRLWPSQSATAPPRSTGPALLKVLGRTEVRGPPWATSSQPRSEVVSGVEYAVPSLYGCRFLRSRPHASARSTVFKWPSCSATRPRPYNSEKTEKRHLVEIVQMQQIDAKAIFRADPFAEWT
ncbi:hypothetical protein NDU88_005379 [Pleurodeles waltl]|uniref:Uncharacterized protein n=1 Tax=Pleurodeles waltl TaxID=8319 RepID=A0AAV7WBC8_PLEWA|nr:hypothetical protein NDU88_005379 [Pleurodeles waltl]